MLAGLTGQHIAMAGRLGSGPALGPNTASTSAVQMQVHRHNSVNAHGQPA
jgi:hypothetical protein